MSESATQAVTGLPTGFTEDANGIFHGPNGTPIGKVAKAPPVPKAKPAAKTVPPAVTVKPKANGKPKPATKANIKAKPAAAVAGKLVRSRAVITDKSPAERRLIVVKALRKAGADGPMSAVSADQIAAKTGLSRFDVYGQLYHTHFLQVKGFAKQVAVEGTRGLCYHLTAKGMKATDEQLAGS